MSGIRITGDAVVQQKAINGELKLTTFIPLKIKKRGGKRIIVQPETGHAQSPHAPGYDSPMLMALSRAFHWQRLLSEGLAESGSDIAKREGLHPSTVNELLRLTMLEPAIIQSILAGQQPKCMSLIWFQRNPLPVDWLEQRKVIAAFDK
ncbi:site-specific recombinase resolvase [Methylomonas sp. 2BW1-5-20]|uniref:site-specific recombinase resolvase n=1 Tax=Methylomonas sp. 2BW1-5-20 TaxID=3376686 RepID=UPI00404CE26D